jgi:hypothetical protein
MMGSPSLAPLKLENDPLRIGNCIEVRLHVGNALLEPGEFLDELSNRTAIGFSLGVHRLQRRLLPPDRRRKCESEYDEKQPA